jgi:hypothetical protein
MMSRTLKLLPLFVLLHAQTATAQLVDENILIKLPPGYKVGFQDKKSNMLMTEMVPTNETVHNWTEMVTMQIFYGLKVTPEQFKERISKGWLSSCAGSEAHQVASGVENGYPSLVWLLTCPLNNTTGKPEITWLKGMRGNDSFYLVQKAFKFTPSKEQVTQWMLFLKAVMLCDTRLPDRPCPQLPK